MSTPETTYLQDGDVTITSARAVIGQKTYAMSNITSVSMGEKSASLIPVLILLLIGLPMVLCSFTGERGPNWGLVVLGAIVAGAGVLVLFRSKPTYMVQIGSASGETRALESRNKAQIKKIVDAMNEAIVKRG